MISITIKNFKSAFCRICILTLVVALVFWGVPKFYNAMAEGEKDVDDLRELTEPLRVQANPNVNDVSAWFNSIDK
ncbi:MAG: hypothetical protein RR219_02225 [Clostridiales bacterium]